LFAAELRELITEGRVRLIGPVRQELLSGIRENAQFLRLREDLRTFEDHALRTEDYEDAAHLSNQCRSAGITGSPIDFLICAVAVRCNWEILTGDHDFRIYSRVIPIRLYIPRPSKAPLRDRAGGES
jgi:predicted nucleic acid-binding protein